MSSIDPNQPKNQDSLPNISQPQKSTNEKASLSSAQEQTRAYPSETSNTHSSASSQNAHPHDEEEGKKQQESEVKKTQSLEDKIRGSFRKLSDPKKVDEIYQYATDNKTHTITYLLLAIGLIVLFFNSLIGGLIVGGVAGYHFAPEIIYYIRNMRQIAGGQDQLRYITLTALLLGLFITTPGIFLGAAIVAAFRQVLEKTES